MAGTRTPLTARKGTEILFFDLQEVDRQENVVLSVCQAQKHPHNPVMLPGDKDAWDSAQAAPWSMRAVLYDEEMKKFCCWYTGTDIAVHAKCHAGYAESDDGIVWEKPELGLFAFEGSKRNNIINDAVWCSIIKDHSEKNPRRRYKSRTLNLISYSPDGLNWGKYREGKRKCKERAADTVAFLRDDQDPNPDRRYKMVYQYYDKSTKPGPELVRQKGIAYSRDGVTFKGSPRNPILSPNDGFEHENHFLMYIPYKGHYLVLYECGWYHPDDTGVFGRYTADIRLAHSRDGERFTRINPHEIVIPRGDASEWDGQFLVITDKIIIKDDTLYIYYCGQDMGWTSWPSSNAAPGNRFFRDDCKEMTGCTARSCMGLATMRLDGFTCIRTVDGHSFGNFTTKPITLPRGKTRPKDLSINISNAQASRSYVAVEVLDAKTRKPMPGFSRADCVPAYRDAIRQNVRWKNRPLREVKRSPIRLRFHLYGAARLHSYQFL